MIDFYSLFYNMLSTFLIPATSTIRCRPIPPYAVRDGAFFVLLFFSDTRPMEGVSSNFLVALSRSKYVYLILF